MRVQLKRDFKLHGAVYYTKGQVLQASKVEEFNGRRFATVQHPDRVGTDNWRSTVSVPMTALKEI